MAPQRNTRMGAAIRHAARQLSAVPFGELSVGETPLLEGPVPVSCEAGWDAPGSAGTATVVVAPASGASTTTTFVWLRSAAGRVASLARIFHRAARAAVVLVEGSDANAARTRVMASSSARVQGQ